MKPTYQPNSKLDLCFTRVVQVPRAMVWRAWTEPELLKPWFCPLPWKTIDCEIDLRPGGMFRTTMQSPEGVERYGAESKGSGRTNYAVRRAASRAATRPSSVGTTQISTALAGACTARVSLPTASWFRAGSS